MSTEFKHTPGPWEVWENEKSSVLKIFAPQRAPGFQRSCFVRGIEFKAIRNGAGRGIPVTYAGFSQEDEANARLIAAAPELLQCLQNCLAVRPHKECVEAMKAMIREKIKKATE